MDIVVSRNVAILINVIIAFGFLYILRYLGFFGGSDD